MRRRRPRRAAAVAVALVAALAATGCSGTASERPRTGGTLQLEVAPAALSHFDPQRIDDADGAALLGGYVFRSLTASTIDDASSATLVPDLAADTGTSGDGGLTWTFRLRQGILFDNSLPLTCTDFAYGISRNFARELGFDGTGPVSVLDVPRQDDGTSAFLGPYVAAPAGSDADAAAQAYARAVECAGDGSTITFRLREPTGDFPELVTLPAFAPVPTTADIGAQYDQRPIGTGPYRVDTLEIGVAATLVRNTSWEPSQDPQRAAWPERIEVRAQADPAAATAAIPASEAPVAGPAVPPGLVDDALAEASTTVTQLTGWTRHLAVNTARVTDPAVRRAIRTALDRRAYRDALTGPRGADLADGLVPPTFGDYSPLGAVAAAPERDIPPEGDPALAREMLDGVAVPPTLTLDIPDTGPDQAAARVVVDDLARLGIRVEVRAVPVADYAAFQRDPDAYGDLVTIDLRPVIPSGLRAVRAVLGPDASQNASRYVGGADALAAAAPQTDQNVRARLVAEAVVAALDDGALVPMLFYRTYRVAAPGVGGARLSPVWGTWSYGDLWVRD